MPNYLRYLKPVQTALKSINQKCTYQRTLNKKHPQLLQVEGIFKV